jgi:hypothetical protein
MRLSGLANHGLAKVDEGDSQLLGPKASGSAWETTAQVKHHSLLLNEKARH